MGACGSTARRAPHGIRYERRHGTPLESANTWHRMLCRNFAASSSAVACRYFRISSTRAKEIEILYAVERAEAAWRNEGRAIGMTVIELDQFADAFERAER